MMVSLFGRARAPHMAVGAFLFLGCSLALPPPAHTQPGAPAARSQRGGVESGPAKRPMAFLDMQEIRQVGSPTPSPDGRWMLYTLSVPDWKEAKRQTDIQLVSLDQGVPSTKQMTFTKD